MVIAINVLIFCDGLRPIGEAANYSEAGRRGHVSRFSKQGGLARVQKDVCNFKESRETTVLMPFAE
jgi:hypothetical protein